MKILGMLMMGAAVVAAQGEETVWIDELPLEGWDIGVRHFETTRNLSVASKFGKPVPLKVGEQEFKRGIGTHAPALVTYEFEGEVLRFEAAAGVDAWVIGQSASGIDENAKVKFQVVADGKVVAESPVMYSSSPAHEFKVELKGAKTVALVIDALGWESWDISLWGDARFTVADGTKVKTWVGDDDQLGILTPKPSAAPRINGAKVFGVRPGHEILWRLAVTGERPLELSAANLPAGAKFDPQTGRLSGSVAERGEYPIEFTAKNAKGTAKSVLKLKVGDTIALTPPMGWNSWNCFGPFVTAEKIKAAADAFIATGLADHGWSYINIDDFWQNSAELADDRTLAGPLRNAEGEVVSNARFPSMKELADYIHSQGLKAGIYSSPAAVTCGRCEGTWGHEWKDAETYAKWGYDYLKYDGCSYPKVAVGEGMARDMLPYLVMGEALKCQNRDIVFSVNTYDDSSERLIHAGGGRLAGANSWRTTGDINDAWSKVREIIDVQRHRWPFSSPGAWNDPDMLIVGVIGGPWKCMRPTRLTPNMQYTHVSLWSMLCAPFLIGCDLTKLDDFTLALLTNDEVIDVSQDELGAQAEMVASGPRAEIWAKPMSDGSYVFGLFNTARKRTTITADFAALGLEGKWRVRDVWRQQDLGIYGPSFTCDVPPLATTMVRLYPLAGAGLRQGLTDIRMNGYYHLMEPSRPVGRPGYEPPKGYPCRDCPRGK